LTKDLWGAIAAKTTAITFVDLKKWLADADQETEIKIFEGKGKKKALPLPSPPKAKPKAKKHDNRDKEVVKQKHKKISKFDEEGV
jgi:hypothetical protein